MKTVVVPVDFSPTTTKVCDAACALADQIKARLVLLHVVQPPSFMMNDYYTLDSDSMTEMMDATEKGARKKLLALGRRYEKGARRVQTVQITGAPVASIIQHATASRAAYLVIGSHGHGAVFDLLVGSTTHGVLRKAPCPVLVVPPTAK